MSCSCATCNPRQGVSGDTQPPLVGHTHKKKKEKKLVRSHSLFQKKHGEKRKKKAPRCQRALLLLPRVRGETAAAVMCWRVTLTRGDRRRQARVHLLRSVGQPRQLLRIPPRHRRRLVGGGGEGRCPFNRSLTTSPPHTSFKPLCNFFFEPHWLGCDVVPL